MLVATVLYIAVAVTAVSVVPWRELAAAPGPLAEVMKRAAPWMPGWFYVAITVFAVANTALLNYVTASRLTFGMARQGLLPKALGRLHPGTRTPHVADRGAVRDRGRADAERRHHPARLGDRAAAAGGVRPGEHLAR